MSQTTTMTVRLSGALRDFVSSNISTTGNYENVSEYVRDLIRRDKEMHEKQAFDRLKAELEFAFAQPENTYREMTAAEFFARHHD